MDRIIKVLIYKFAFISTTVALLLMVIGIKINLNLVSFAILLLFFAFEYFIFQKFLSQIKVFHSEEIKKIKKKYQKDIKVENLEEISRKKTEEIAQLKANEQFRKEFIGNVAHELKTPIFNVQGFIATLLDGAINDPQVNVKYLERSDKNIQRLISLVKDLDTISKLETGKIIPEYQNFDLNEVITEVFDVLEVKSNEYGVNLVYNEQKNVNVYADKEKITEVLHNLIINSVIYGQKDGKTVVSIKEKKKKYIISVKDNGIGIAEKDLKHIFERFFRVDKSRSRERGGSGLGLAIVKHIIDAHNQTITVESKANVGTTFSFSLQKVKVV